MTFATRLVASVLGRATRLILALLLMHGIVFFLLLVLPSAAALQTSIYGASEEFLEGARDSLGVPSSIPEAYGTSLLGLLQGDLGRTMTGGNDVAALLVRAISTSLPVWACALAVVVAFLLVTPPYSLAGMEKTKRILYGISGLLLVPAFLLAVMVHSGVRLIGPSSFLVGDGRIVLAGIATGAYSGALLFRQASATYAMLGHSNFARTYRAFGITPVRLLARLSRNARILMRPHLARATLALLASGTFAEYTFDVHGVGYLLVTAVRANDIPVVQACTLFFGASVCLLGSVERGKGFMS